MLSRCVWRDSTRTTFRRSAAASRNERSNRSTAVAVAAISAATLASRPESVARGRRMVDAPLLDLGEPVAQRGDQERLALRIGDEIVLQVRIARDDPDVAQHLEQHPRGAPGAALAAELLQQLPHRRAEQPDHDLAIRERRVVVGDLAQPGCVRAAGAGVDSLQQRFGVAFMCAAILPRCNMRRR